MNADAFTQQIIQSYMLSTVREMMRTTRASAYSVIFTEGDDFTCAITAPDGRLTYQAEGVGTHAGSFPDAIGLILEHYDEFAPGDVLCHNEPYRGGSHQADLAFARPVFAEGRLIAFVANRGHWSDIGGMSGGGWAGNATHVLQEALIVPPVKIYKAGVLDDEIRRMVLSNVRNPSEAWGTLQAQVASLLTAEQRIHEVVDRYGLAALETATEAWLEYGRTRFLTALQTLPNGEWSAEDRLDDDGSGDEGPFVIRATIRKQGDELGVDFTGTSRQARGPANTNLTNARSAALITLMAIIDPDLPLNSGWFDLIEVTAPLGTLVNPTYPAPMFNATGSPSIRCSDVVLRALAAAVPDRTAAFTGNAGAFVLYFRDEASGAERSWMHYTGGGGGARATKDGLNGVWYLKANCKLESVELIESRFPVLVERQSWQRPSAGPGRFRSGLGIERELVLRDDALAAAVNDRHKVPPWGLLGGEGGACAQYTLLRGEASGDFEQMAGTKSRSKFGNVELRRGDRLILASGGGGGYGDPLDRDPAAVLADVEEGYLSPAEAAGAYAVVIAGTGELDLAATAALRERRRADGARA